MFFCLFNKVILDVYYFVYVFNVFFCIFLGVLGMFVEVGYEVVFFGYCDYVYEFVFFWFDEIWDYMDVFY